MRSIGKRRSAAGSSVACLLLGLVGCASDGSVGGGGSGSPDSELAEAGDTAAEVADSGADAASLDASDGAVDGTGTDAGDAGSHTGDAPQDAASEVAGADSGAEATDAGDVQPDALDVAEVTPDDGSSGFETLLGECEEIGIGTTWKGTWIGELDYVIAGLMGPDAEHGFLPVSGTLAFDIQCIESKLVVSGTMVGVAEVPDYDDAPFTLGMQGYYDPASQQLDAQILDGMVSVLGVIEFYFEGDMRGTVNDAGGLDGTWEGLCTGTNTPVVTCEPTSGAGTWDASEAGI